ncbi:MAG TPA: hypothetical protein PKM95_07990 [Deltaproteobacteria bacterium]|nr:hypothetical protein [Deltaproteobacteria bacterium]
MVSTHVVCVSILPARGVDLLFVIDRSARMGPAQAKLAREFAQWMTSERGQKLVADFKLMGKPLFYPNAGK